MQPQSRFLRHIKRNSKLHPCSFFTEEFVVRWKKEKLVNDEKHHIFSCAICVCTWERKTREKRCLTFFHSRRKKNRDFWHTRVIGAIKWQSRRALNPNSDSVSAYGRMVNPNTEQKSPHFNISIRRNVPENANKPNPFYLNRLHFAIQYEKDSSNNGFHPLKFWQ